MRAEIIAVGSEMLTPDHIDTNSLYVTARLNDAGVEVGFKTVVGDNAADMAALLRISLERSHLIVISGGLGPTEDDLTRNVVAEVLGRTVSSDPQLLEALRQRFAARGYRMAANNARQAEVIDGATVLPNPVGTAPGQWLEHGDRAIVLLPGPPRELKGVFEASVLPRVREKSAGRRMAGRLFYLTGLTESEADSRAAPIYTGYSRIQTTILANPAHIALRMQRWLNTGETESDLDELAARIRAEFGNAIFSESGETLEEVIGRTLADRGLTISVAESCTAGVLGMKLTRVPGSSRYFTGGVLCYANEVKTQVCGVSGDTLQSFGAVSPQTAEELALGVCRRLQTSLGISITGIAGPDGGSAEKPVGLVFVGISDGVKTTHFRRVLPGDRDSVRERAAVFAMSSLRNFLLEKDRPGAAR